jgi:DNA topoisomerase-1
MGKSLVIVESPAKAKTINKYLGRNYTVKASYGHIMDLPKKVLGIDVTHGFEPTYEVSPSKTAVVSTLQKAASTADAVYLAGDPDREGEAICAHLAEVLSGPKLEFPTEEELEKEKELAKENGKKGKKKAKKPVKKVVAKGKPVIARKNIFRVMFNEITPKAIKAAFEHPGEINENLVDAQQARRVLDRLVGYKISPLLWDKVRRGLSAGRVQTVALRLIVDREVEIRAFKPVEYWTIHALLAAGAPPIFEAKLNKYKGEDIEIRTQAEADAVVAATGTAQWKVACVTQK